MKSSSADPFPVMSPAASPPEEPMELVHGLEALMEEAEIADSLKQIEVVVNRPTCLPQMPVGSEDCVVPADGMCLYHCCTAVRDVHVWLRGRKPSGYAENPEQVNSDEDSARGVKREILQIISTRAAAGTQEAKAQAAETLVRLELTSKEGYPGMDEMDYVAEFLGGQVLIQEESGVQIVYGQGPLVAFFRQVPGKDAEHWQVIQSWMPRGSLPSARKQPDNASEVRGVFSGDDNPVLDHANDIGNPAPSRATTLGDFAMFPRGTFNMSVCSNAPLDLASSPEKKRRVEENALERSSDEQAPEQDWQQWECDLMKSLREDGDGVDVEEDKLVGPPTLWGEMMEWSNGVMTSYPDWKKYVVLVRHAFV